MGSVKESIDYLVKYCLMPFDQQTILILNVFEELIDWQWGFTCLVKIGDFLTFILDRTKKYSKDVLEAKFKFVSKIANSGYMNPELNFITEVTRKSLI